MGMRKDVPHAKCSPLCAIKEKLQALWDRAYGCINQINDITPDGDGKFTIQGGQNISITPISNGLAFDADYPSGVLTINGQTPDADGDISGIATTDQLTDGSVTKVGTANVGTDTKPIKLVDGVPTAVTNDLVDVSSAQTISANKTFSGEIYLQNKTELHTDDPSLKLCNTGITRGTIPGTNKFSSFRFEDINNVTVGVITHNYYADGDASVRVGIENALATGGSSELVIANSSNGNHFVKASYRPYNSAHTTDVVTIGSLAANPNVVHTTGNEEINGSKRFVLPIRKVHANMTQGKPASSFTSDMFTFQTANGQVISEIFMLYGTDGSVKLYGRNVNPDGTTGSSVLISTLRSAY